MTEVIDTFPCFGSTCAVVVDAGDDETAAHDSVAMARRLLLGWHDAFSRFLPTSELSRLNADPRSEVPVSPLMGRLVGAIADAAAQTGGLVDGTLLRELETAGYRGDLGRPLALELALRLAPRRRPARPSRDASWRRIAFDEPVTHARYAITNENGGIVVACPNPQAHGLTRLRVTEDAPMPEASR